MLTPAPPPLDSPAPDLLSLVLEAMPTAPHPRPPYVGRAVHALLLHAIEEQDPALSVALHAGSEVRPFTASGLLDIPQGGLRPGTPCRIRLTALNEPACSALLRSAESGCLSPGSALDLAGVGLTLAAALQTSDGHSLAAVTRYQDLSAPWLLASRPPRTHLRLRLTTPTTFHSGGRHVPFPLPGLVFGSLLARWNAHAPVALPDEVRRFAEECMAASRFNLATRSIPIREGGLRTGAVGWVEFVILNRDHYWMSVVELLADYCLFAGLGAGVTMGLGQARREALVARID